MVRQQPINATPPLRYFGTIMEIPVREQLARRPVTKGFLPRISYSFYESWSMETKGSNVAYKERKMGKIAFDYFK